MPCCICAVRLNRSVLITWERLRVKISSIKFHPNEKISPEWAVSTDHQKSFFLDEQMEKCVFEGWLLSVWKVTVRGHFSLSWLSLRLQLILNGRLHQSHMYICSLQSERCLLKGEEKSRSQKPQKGPFRTSCLSGNWKPGIGSCFVAFCSAVCMESNQRCCLSYNFCLFCKEWWGLSLSSWHTS